MKWSVVFLLFVAGAQEAPVAIGGTVVNFQTGAPLEGVRVWLALTTARDREAGSALTKADGRFAFRVPKGSIRCGRSGMTWGGSPTGRGGWGRGWGLRLSRMGE